MIRKLCNRAGKLVAVIQILALTLLASCATVGSHNSLTVCHATDDPANPYEEITVSRAELNEHLGHPNDRLFPQQRFPGRRGRAGALYGDPGPASGNRGARRAHSRA